MKANLWPFGIILTFIVFISGTVGLVVMACTHSTELVNANYYDQEIKYQARIDSRARAEQAGATVSYDKNARHIVITLPAKTIVTGQIQLYRPSASGLDKEFKLEPASNGIQTLDATGSGRLAGDERAVAEEIGGRRNRDPSRDHAFDEHAPGDVGRRVAGRVSIVV